MQPVTIPDGDRQGTCAFRLMPTDELAPFASQASTATEAHGWCWTLRYTWTHAEDGEQSGTLLVGSPDEAGVIKAAWIDSWHQKPSLGLLEGRAVAGRVALTMDYDGWGWVIEVGNDGAALLMRMLNVAPEGVEGFSGPYVVMDARWQ